MIAICYQELLLYSVVFCCIALYCTAWHAAIMEDSLLCIPPGVIYEGLFVVCLYESLSGVSFTEAFLWCLYEGLFAVCLYEGLFVVSLRRPICGVLY